MLECPAEVGHSFAQSSAGSDTCIGKAAYVWISLGPAQGEPTVGVVVVIVVVPSRSENYSILLQKHPWVCFGRLKPENLQVDDTSLRWLFFCSELNAYAQGDRPGSFEVAFINSSADQAIARTNDPCLEAKVGVIRSLNQTKFV